MIYILYNISNSNYQRIVSELLEYSIIKSGQKGQVIQIQSLDANEKFESSIGITYKIDSALRKTLKNDQVSFNELYTFHKIFDIHSFNDDDLLFFVDPDMIFESAIDLEGRIEDGEIWGQRWMDYSKDTCFHNYDNSAYCPDESIMYPYLIKAKDALAIRDYILTSGINQYNTSVSWMMSMFVFTTSYEFGNLKSKLVDNLCLCNTWPNREDDSPMLHYMQPVRDKNASVIWHKHRSIKKEFLTIPDPSLATNKFDHRLLSYLQEYAKK